MIKNGAREIWWWYKLGFFSYFSALIGFFYDKLNSYKELFFCEKNVGI